MDGTPSLRGGAAYPLARTAIDVIHHNELFSYMHVPINKEMKGISLHAVNGP